MVDTAVNAASSRTGNGMVEAPDDLIQGTSPSPRLRDLYDLDRVRPGLGQRYSPLSRVDGPEKERPRVLKEDHVPLAHCGVCSMRVGTSDKLLVGYTAESDMEQQRLCLSTLDKSGVYPVSRAPS
ncbi:Secreted protein [Venturia inaequalis]|nr:Secreted protein [Venturia inaequalis]